VTHSKIDAKTLYLKLKERNVLVRHFGKKPIDDYLRITIGTEKEMHRLVDTLKEII